MANDEKQYLQARIKKQRRELRRLNAILKDRDEWRRPKEFLQYRTEKKFHKRTQMMEQYIVNRLVKDGMDVWDAWRVIRTEFHERG